MSDWEEEYRLRRENAQHVVDGLGLTITSEFVPFSRSRHAKPDKDGKVWKSLNWMVTLQRTAGGTTRRVLTTPYGAGIAHCPAHKNPPCHVGFNAERGGKKGAVDEWLRDKMIDWEIEHGRHAREVSYATFAPVGTKKIEPDALDVIYSLVMDADMLEHAGIADWADSYGYDADRISHKEIYDTCLAHALALRSAVGEDGMAKLREAFEEW